MRSRAAQHAVEVLGDADDLEVGLQVEQRPDAFADEQRVVGEEHRDHRVVGHDHHSIRTARPRTREGALMFEVCWHPRDDTGRPHSIDRPTSLPCERPVGKSFGQASRSARSRRNRHAGRVVRHVAVVDSVGGGHRAQPRGVRVRASPTTTSRRPTRSTTSRSCSAPTGSGSPTGSRRGSTSRTATIVGAGYGPRAAG